MNSSHLTTGREILGIEDAGQKQDIKSKRRLSVRRLMEQQGLEVKNVISRLGVSGEEAKGWKAFLYNVRSDTKEVNVTPDRAQALAPILGVQLMALLGDYTDFERRKMKKVLTADGSASPAVTIEVPLDPDERKEAQRQALDTLMSERELSAKGLAQTIEGDSFNVDMIAMQIADARQGEIPLTREVCERIASVLQIDLATIFPTVKRSSTTNAVVSTRKQGKRKTTRQKETSVEAPPSEEKKELPNRRGKKPGAGKREEVPQEERRTLSQSEEELATVSLSVDEFRQYFRGRAIRVVRAEQGRSKYVLRAEASLTQGELLELLLKLNNQP